MASIGGAAATILAAKHHPQAAVKVDSIGFVCLIVVVNLVIWKYGTSLVRTIDRSLQNNATGNSKAASIIVKDVSEVDCGSRDLNLLAARKNTKIAMTFCLVMAVQTVLVLVFAVVSTYGAAAPLLFFGIPMGPTPLLWLFFDIQMHAGRSTQCMAQQWCHTQASRQLQQLCGVNGVRKSMKSRSSGILPVETPARLDDGALGPGGPIFLVMEVMEVSTKHWDNSVPECPLTPPNHPIYSNSIRWDPDVAWGWREVCLPHC